jgi:D-psicose/D-tagatose/L-ribulose 3-epimerase
MPKLGAHAFVWIGDWHTDLGNETIQKAAKAGFDFLEIPVLDPYHFEASSHRAALKKHKLAATCSLALPRNMHLPKHPKRAKKFLEKALEQVEAVGSQHLGGCTAYSLGVLTGTGPTREEIQTVIDVLGPLAEKAHGKGITLYLEACNRYETYMFNTLEDTRKTILEIGAPNLRLHADTYHMNIEEEGFYKPFLATKDVLGYIHMSESHRGMVGTGTVNWDEVFKALHDIKFDGFLVLESFAAMNEAIKAATCLWRAPKHKGAALAAGGLKVLQEGAAKAGLI